jgi:cytidylate kinase
VFLTAAPEERARRRQRELEMRGESLELNRLLELQNERDRRDAARPVGRLVMAPDALEVATDGLTQNQVVDVLERLVRERM